jgi:arsenate reductase
MTDLVACLTAELIGPPGTVRRIARTARAAEECALCTGTAAQIDAAFENTYRTLRDRIEAFLALPLADLQRDRGRFKAELDRIGDMSC